ncbi:hypothetical protein [Haladaptatus pallidirubidus]|uniref:hypothetical protein n=1 Tax=Haladaptatus pallidirubidus TaxID=1008152 RepID=UPI0036F381EC
MLGEQMVFFKRTAGTADSNETATVPHRPTRLPTDSLVPEGQSSSVLSLASLTRIGVSYNPEENGKSQMINITFSSHRANRIETVSAIYMVLGNSKLRRQQTVGWRTVGTGRSRNATPTIAFGESPPTVSHVTVSQ